MKPLSNHKHDLAVYHDWLLDEGKDKEAEWLREDTITNPDIPWNYEYRVSDGVGVGSISGGGGVGSISGGGGGVGVSDGVGVGGVGVGGVSGGGGGGVGVGGVGSGVGVGGVD